MTKNPGLRRGLHEVGDPEKAKGRMRKNTGTKREVAIESTGRRSSGRGSK